MNKIKIKSLHLKDALRLLEDGEPHQLRLWKLSTGDILTYNNAIHIGGHKRRGTHRVKLPTSALIRCFRDVTLFEIDGLSVYW